MWIEKILLVLQILTPIVIITVIVLQFRSFWKNKKKMKEYSIIFAGRDWSLNTDSQTGQVIGINGKGNSTFNAIKEAINKYLKSNAGGIIDYALLRETVDRNCDSLEDEISAQTPVPLYWGLCGTMGGVIIGLGSLLLSGAITKLVGNAAAGIIAAAAQGVNSLLIGVAFAMCASVCGIILTIYNTIVFKNSKQQEESGKNAFLTWMQEKLLPVLPTNMSNALTEMSRNLNCFNETFSKNVVQLDGTLSKVNEVYRGQQDVISKVCQMDPMRMAEANVKTLSELENCLAKFPIFSDQVEKFSQYLVKIDEFTEKLNKEIYRLDILEGIKDSMNEIKEFFGRHKEEIERDVVDSGNTLNEALREFRNASKTSVGELQKALTDQASELSKVIDKEKDLVVDMVEGMSIKFIGELDAMKKQSQRLLNDMQNEFQEQLDKLPIQEELRQISSIPTKIDETTKRMENTNTTLIGGVKICIEGMTSSISELHHLLEVQTKEFSKSIDKLTTSMSQILDEIKKDNSSRQSSSWTNKPQEKNHSNIEKKEETPEDTGNKVQSSETQTGGKNESIAVEPGEGSLTLENRDDSISPEKTSTQQSNNHPSSEQDGSQDVNTQQTQTGKDDEISEQEGVRGFWEKLKRKFSKKESK